ncbi:glutaredoxin family protein [Arthrobacter sp. EH-1B-1]|uniref:Glutaredoxin family protein n=1 Tax=Arthrobacter vasquezii TaxID=2977629 RepID=A0ABT6CXM2_9MICC|nr:glutaredoxin family protein [Arthrobacter vasquezii]MDF9278841.1 glutaredoxin family protein [Arthrobacter vasquezii]
MQEKKHSLVIYIKPTGCFGCDKTKQLFTAAGVTFTAVDITTNTHALEYVTGDPADGGLGYSQAPVVVYDKGGSEDHWSGLNPTKIKQVIALDASE